MDARHIGRYSIADAAWLVGLHPSRVRRWLGITGAATVMRHPGTPSDQVSFLDLAELDIVRRLVEKGADIRRLRAAVVDAQNRFNVSHPLAQRRFLIDGTELFDDDGEHVLQLGRSGQLALAPIIRARAEVYDFAADGLAERIWPLGKGSPVVIDPDFVGGEPSIKGTRWTTRAIAQAVAAEEGVEAMAALYNLPEEQVRWAIEYETLLSAA